jgi:MFS family permease
MISTFLSFGALFTSALLFVMGGALVNTQLSLSMTQNGFATPAIGVTMACYFLGLVVGYFLCHRLIQRVGHIRSFAVFAAATTIIIILHGFYISVPFWAFLRFINGISNFGLFMVVESWLNECSESHNRGRIFSVYMTLAYIGICIGQLFLNFGQTGGQSVLMIAAVLFSLSLIPVTITRTVHPELPEPDRYTLKALLRKAPVGMSGCFAAGLMNSAFFSMAPVFGTRIGLSTFQLSWFMSITVFGGFTVQWLVGIISDRFERTLMLVVMGCLIALYSLIVVINTEPSYTRLLVEMGVFGGFLFAVYPVSVARAHDVFEAKDAVAVSSALLLCYSIGAIFGPILASAVMAAFKNPFGLYIYWSLVAGLLAAITLYLRRKEKIAIIPVEDQVNYIPMKNTSSVAMVMDPRTETDDVSRT